MKAFAVELPPGTILIRVGLDTDCWGKSFDYALPMLPDGTLTGLTKNPESEVGNFTAHHMRALKELVEGELKREWHWDRINHDNERTVTMARKDFTKASAHSVHRGRDGNNEIDQKATDATILALVQGREASGLVYTAVETTEIAVGGSKRKVRAVIELQMK